MGAQLEAGGVARLGPVLEPDALVFTRALFAWLRHRGWPLVFAALHPRFWALFRSRALDDALGAAVGDGWLLAPRLWPVHIAPLGGASGWRPHLDATRAPRPGERVTLWLAITRATAHNGCMFVVPRDVAGTFPADVFKERALPAERALPLLHAARALPCAAGEALCWEKDVIHWGGVATGDDDRPRVSIVAEAMRADAKLELAEGHALDVTRATPSFAERARLVGRQLKKYVAYEEERRALEPLLPLADEMLRA